MEFLTEEQAEKATKIFLDAIGWSWVEDHHRYFQRGIQAVALFIDSLHKHSLEERILNELRENNWLLHNVIGILTPHRILGGVMSQIGAPMILITPGSNPEFSITALSAGVPVAVNAVWESADPTNLPVTPVASDPTGTTATIAVAETVAVGTTIALTWTYTNADGTKDVVTGSFPVVAPLPVDVTGGTMEQV